MNWRSQEIDELVRRALAEDVGTGDATTAAIVPAGTPAKAHIIARETLVCAGLPIAESIFRALDREIRIGFLHEGGSFVESGAELVEIAGEAQAILTGERTALNFLAHLCGIATLTRRFVEQLEGTRARIRDTRKTTPGLRSLEKYAVKCGGGTNHRFGLYDAILIKENHIAVAGGVREALDAGAEAVLLDNMTPEAAKHCVQLARNRRRDCVIEISGGITLDSVRAYAETGADFLSSGALTHSAPGANLSLLVESVR